MEQKLVILLKNYYYFIFLALGLFIATGSILNWKWLVRFMAGYKLMFVRTWIEETKGAEAKYKFERVMTFCSGVILIGCGIIFWKYYTA